MSPCVTPLQTFGGGCDRLLDPRLSLHQVVPLRRFRGGDVIPLQTFGGGLMSNMIRLRKMKNEAGEHLPKMARRLKMARNSVTEIG